MVYSISTRELRTMLGVRRGVKLVDIEPEEEFVREHIPRAISLPAPDIARKAGRVLDKNDVIIIYDRNGDPAGFEAAAQTLSALGYRHVITYADGFSGYKRADLVTETWL